MSSSYFKKFRKPVIVLASASVIASIFLFLHIDDLEHVLKSNRPAIAQLSHGLLSTEGRGFGPHSSQDIVIYNKVPKTGSTSLMSIAKTLRPRRGFSTLQAVSSRWYWSIDTQSYFISNVSSWTEVMPVLYHGHFAFVDFRKFGVTTSPIYINLLRNPFDRMVSHYYFTHSGDDYDRKRTHTRKRKLVNETFDECIVRRHRDCRIDHLWVQVQMFCGMEPHCRIPGNQLALQDAKHNLVHRYLLVGVTERFNDFINMLELLLPRFFEGASQLLPEDGGTLQLRRTNSKQSVLPSTVALLRRSVVWDMAHDFYNFTKDRFNILQQDARDALRTRFTYTAVHRYHRRTGNTGNEKVLKKQSGIPGNRIVKGKRKGNIGVSMV